jgi:hypothetical protein
MTEHEWLTCDDSNRLLQFLGQPAHPPRERKFWLLAAAFCRRVWHLLAEERHRCAVEAVERFANRAEPRPAPIPVLWATGNFPHWSVQHAALAVNRVVGLAHVGSSGLRAALAAATQAATALAYEAVSQGGGERREVFEVARANERRGQCAVIRCVFANPFLPSATSLWRTPEVLQLAGAAAAERTLPAGTLDPLRLAILGDALEEAGCTDEALLDHLRGPGPHVKGCHVVDALLERG